MDINDPQEDINTNQETNQEQKLGYVYRHIRLDTNVPFYIGISTVNNGKHTRAYEKEKRSNEWKDIVKYAEYRVDILLENIPLSILGYKEKYFIKLYGRIDLGTGTLVNKTSGGQGSHGYIMTEETRKKKSEWQIGRVMSPESIEKSRKANLGRKASIETRKKLSNIHKGHKYNLGRKTSEETKKKQSEAKKGKKKSEQTRKNMSKAQKGKIVSTETRHKIRNNTPSKPVGQYDNGILIKEYPSVKSTALDGYTFGAVSSCCLGKLKSYKGFQWRFIEQPGSKKMKERITTEETREKMRKQKSCKPIGQYDNDDNLIKEFPSIASTKLDGFNHSLVGMCCRNKRNHHGGFIWKFI